MVYKKIISVLLVNILFLSGCAYFRKPAPAVVSYVPWKTRYMEHRKIKRWDMSGVLSITHKKKRDIVRFAWNQNYNDYSIKLSGPMNMGGVRIDGSKERVKFWRSSDEVIEASTPEELVSSELGWSIPVSDIRYWVLGMPAPGKVDYKYFDRYGHLNFFKQNGWRVKYSSFQVGVRKNLDLPSIVELQNKDVAVKIKIKELDLL